MSLELPEDVIGQGFCIYIDTLCQSATIAVRDVNNWPVVFTTEHEAQLEIVDFLQTRLQEFVDGERDFHDAITIEEYVMPVSVFRSGAVMGPDQRVFDCDI